MTGFRENDDGTATTSSGRTGDSSTASSCRSCWSLTDFFKDKQRCCVGAAVEYSRPEELSLWWTRTIGMTPRVKIIIEQLARMRVAGIRDNIIAAKLGMTQSGLSRILALPEYRELEEAVLMGTVSKMDSALAGRADAMKDYLRQGVPVALRALVETVSQTKDLRARLSAASELLDRDPDKTFAKGAARLDERAPSVSEAMLDTVTEGADKIGAAATTLAKQKIN
jgi:putative ribosome biogenesis GTPase RsgA